MNMPLVLPAAMVKLTGTVAEFEVEPSVNVIPPFGAGPVRVTVAVEGEPPFTDVGLRTKDVRVGGRIVS